MQTLRVLQITLEKCGSQWIRDVLSAPAIVARSGFPHSGISQSRAIDTELAPPEQTVSGPIYDMTAEEWTLWHQTGDRAIVVLRDPRDRFISFYYSLMYSHKESPRIRIARRMLADAPPRDRFQHLMNAEARYVRVYNSWLKPDSVENARVVRFEALLAEEFAEFDRIFAWLGWQVPEPVLSEVIETNSFARRSGRNKGETDNFSHYRGGIAGDWRNHFDRALGELWESLYPGYLREIGYETDDDWYRNLPARTSVLQAETAPAPGAGSALAAEALERRNALLEQMLIEKEAQIQLLSKACDERLRLIEQLDQALQSRQAARSE